MANTQSKGKKIIDIIVVIIKVLVFSTYGLTMTGAAVWLGAKAVSLTAAFVTAGVYPLGRIMADICETLAMVSFAAFAWRFTFSKKLSWLRYSLISRYLVIFLVATAIFESVDRMQTDDWAYSAYPPYITQWDTDVLYSTQDCDYTDGLYFEGYMDFISSGFREYANVVVEEDSSLTDAYRVEVHYKGLPAEMYIYSDGERENISVYLTNYDYELSAEDYVYMYTHKVDLEYSTPLVIEKIIIRTAYPEKVDVSGIEG